MCVCVREGGGAVTDAPSALLSLKSERFSNNVRGCPPTPTPTCMRTAGSVGSMLISSVEAQLPPCCFPLIWRFFRPPDATSLFSAAMVTASSCDAAAAQEGAACSHVHAPNPDVLPCACGPSLAGFG